MSIKEQEKREKLKHKYEVRANSHGVREFSVPMRSLKLKTESLATLLNPLLPPPKQFYQGTSHIYRCIGLKIARIRRQKGLLQRELAYGSGISTSYLSRIERGYHIQGLTIDILIQLAGALRAELKDFFTFTEDEILQAHYLCEAKKMN